jgi:hypothetical protein
MTTIGKLLLLSFKGRIFELTLPSARSRTFVAVCVALPTELQNLQSSGISALFQYENSKNSYTKHKSLIA